MIIELFASTLNRITAIVRCVSSVNAELLDWLRREQTQKTMRNKKVAFFSVVEQEHKIFDTVFIMHAITGLLYISMIYAS